MGEHSLTEKRTFEKSWKEGTSPYGHLGEEHSRQRTGRERPEAEARMAAVCGMSKGKAGEASQILWGPEGHGQGVGTSRGETRSYWRVWS